MTVDSCYLFRYCHYCLKGCHYETASNLFCMLPVNKESDPHLSKRYAHLFKLLQLEIVKFGSESLLTLSGNKNPKL